MSSDTELFHPVIELPDPTRAARYQRLVGVDHIKERLRREASVLADPASLTRWAAQHHPAAANASAFTLLRDRAPLLLFAGDVGSGKSALAESFGCDLSDSLRVPVLLYRLKLAARGTGHVGEMTTLIAKSFEQVGAEARRGRTGDGRLKAVTILVVDEADALVQSREATQMHHEDRAGVNAFLAGIDQFAGTATPLLVVLCTNRLAALDPALRRRAAATFEFGRPTEEQRHQVLTTAFDGFELSPGIIDKLVEITGPRSDGTPGFTFSDLTQRLVPAALLRAYPFEPITPDLLVDVATDITPTPAFTDQAAA
ncbi:AAA family ATPase [Myceligenerans xiligouense]|uniref:ATPase family protein associated with various cellular activities (AAA) n=1 Tax=Myceligenerans xiligouense TaxID=253184 RepID=A0A3N4ZKP7_9MICO|nr:AAA family ATPase [Myceligenerans xiligouense]RPF21505.1 ATPase family protein associated with various cellular activities (AAA) [Myceligenerans xiligouense]